MQGSKRNLARLGGTMADKTIHLWETFEITLHARKKYENCYTEVCVWADLKGPGFEKRCFGF